MLASSFGRSGNGSAVQAVGTRADTDLVRPRMGRPCFPGQSAQEKSRGARATVQHTSTTQSTGNLVFGDLTTDPSTRTRPCRTSLSTCARACVTHEVDLTFSREEKVGTRVPLTRRATPVPTRPHGILRVCLLTCGTPSYALGTPISKQVRVRLRRRWCGHGMGDRHLWRWTAIPGVKGRQGRSQTIGRRGDR